jgi:hypothetical protein
MSSDHHPSHMSGKGRLVNSQNLVKVVYNLGMALFPYSIFAQVTYIRKLPPNAHAFGHEFNVETKLRQDCKLLSPRLDC